MLLGAILFDLDGLQMELEELLVMPFDLLASADLPEKRHRLKIHGAMDVETGSTRRIEALTVNAQSVVALFVANMAMNPAKKIHVFLDNARYCHAALVQAWLARPECRIRLHFILAYCPHLNPIERLRGLIRKNVTHNRCYAKFNGFCGAMLTFLREELVRVEDQGPLGGASIHP